LIPFPRLQSWPGPSRKPLDAILRHFFRLPYAWVWPAGAMPSRAERRLGELLTLQKETVGMNRGDSRINGTILLVPVENQ
jgi:hypothetical protein